LFPSLAERASWHAQKKVQEREESREKKKVRKTNQFVKKIQILNLKRNQSIAQARKEGNKAV